MKRKLKVIVIALCLTMAALVVAPVNGRVTVKAATKVKINCTKKTIYEGDSFKLKISGTTKRVKWSSSNRNIATVSSKGVVRGIDGGTNKKTCKITASVDGKRYVCKVTVKSDDYYEDDDISNNTYDDCNKYEKMGVDGLVNLYPLLKDPSSLVINSISYGISTDFKEPVECVVIDYNATNSYGGSVRGYCMVWYSLTDEECFDADCSNSLYKYTVIDKLDKDKLLSIAENYF